MHYQSRNWGQCFRNCNLTFEWPPFFLCFVLWHSSILVPLHPKILIPLREMGWDVRVVVLLSAITAFFGLPGEMTSFPCIFASHHSCFSLLWSILSVCLPGYEHFWSFFFLESNPNTKCSMHTRTRLGKEAWNLQEDHHAASCHNSIISIKGQKILQSMHQLVSRLPTLSVIFFKFRLHENWESGCPQFAPPCSDATAKLSMLQRYMKW